MGVRFPLGQERPNLPEIQAITSVIKGAPEQDTSRYISSDVRPQQKYENDAVELSPEKTSPPQPGEEKKDDPSFFQTTGNYLDILA